jgi:hypothetical protein
MEENASKLAKIHLVDIVQEQCLTVSPKESHSVDKQIILACQDEIQRYPAIQPPKVRPLQLLKRL